MYIHTYIKFNKKLKTLKIYQKLLKGSKPRDKELEQSKILENNKNE